MSIQKYIFRPGINREGTAYDNEGGWFDCNLIRFRSGRPEKFGGWRKTTNSSITGTARALHNWISLEGSKYLGIGTHLKYLIKEGTTINDVTPIRLTTSAGDVTFSASNGSSELTVTDTAHGAVKNDFVTFTGNGGSSVVGAYQINVGLDFYVSSTGWGANGWGDGTWGTTAALSETNQLRLWSHDNFGENLIINARAGGIFRWLESGGLSTRAVELSGITGANLVPTKALQVITSEIDRHLIVLGADPLNASGTARTGSVDPMFVAFSDQENELEFEPKIDNTAGSVRLSSGSTIVGAVKSRQETVIFTDTSVYSMQFVGPPFTFALNLINEATGLVGPNAAVTGPNGVYFMSYDNFYVYNGTVQKIPCSVLNFVFSNFNSEQAYKVTAFTNTKENEIGWFYPSATSQEIDRYVIYNYEEKAWYYGQLVRTVWLDSGVEPFPQAVGSNSLFEHEFGFNDDGSEMTGVFIESSDFDIGDGENFIFIKKIIPDVKFLSSEEGNVNFVTKVRNFPGDSLSTVATSTVDSNTQQSHIRGRGRQAVIRIASNDGDSGNDGVGWRLGATRLDIRQDGRR
jgi:hypothetical protein